METSLLTANQKIISAFSRKCIHTSNILYTKYNVVAVFAPACFSAEAYATRKCAVRDSRYQSASMRRIVSKKYSSLL